MSLTILSVAYPFAPVRSNTAGGAEQVLRTIDLGITDLGHNSIVIACSGSEAAGEIIEIPLPQGWIEPTEKTGIYEVVRKAILKALREWPVDLIHMHGIDFDSYLPQSSVPSLVTIHLPVDWYPAGSFESTRQNLYYNCVSNYQQQTARAVPNLLPYIENGVRVTDFLKNGENRIKKENFVLAIGRICPEKGLHLAIDAAAKANVPIIVAGELFPYEYHHAYFKRELTPRFKTDGVKYMGSVSFETKRKLLLSARCLLVTSQAPETSSLITMESYACGTPVIAFPSGALAHVIEHNKTGFIVRSIEEMAKAIKKIDEISPEYCKTLASERFSATRMVDEYLIAYRRILQN